MKKKFLAVLVSMGLAVCSTVAVAGCNITSTPPEQPNQPNTHTHTFTDEWSSDENYHWHAATCEHSDEISGKAKHNIVSGVCSVCEYSLPNAHTHTYSDSWTYDENHHWHTATCEHSDEISGKAEHNLENGSCTECDFKFTVKATCTFELNEDNSGYIVTGFESEGTVLEIPATHNNLPVVEIGEGAFVGSGLIKAVIPDSVITIGQQAFLKCSSLTEIDLGNGLETIGDYAFQRTGIKNIILPESVTTVNYCAFSYTTELEYIEIAKGVTTVGKYAFWASGVQTIKIDSDTTRWADGQNVFYQCENIETVILGENASAKAYLKFDTVKSVKEFITENNPYNKGVDGILYDADFTKLLRLPGGIKSAEIPEGITEIGDNAAYACTGLEQLKLPETLNIIGEGAFMSTKLKEIIIPDSVTQIKKRAFENCSTLETLHIGKGLRTYYSSNMLNGCKVLNNITVDEDNEYFYAENNCLIYKTTAHVYGGNVLIKANLSGEIPNGVAYLDQNAFYDCTQAENIYIPASVKKTDINVFKRLTNLKSITFENTQGWLVTANGASYPSASISVDVSNPQKNVELFTETYANYWWGK